MKLIKDFDNKLLKRKEIVLETSYGSNPGVTKATADVASHFKTNADLVALKKISNGFGSRHFSIEAFLYNNIEDKNKIEPKKKEKKTN